ncbi:MAG TPA: hypothetical protein VFO72_04490, partial [Pyrinomonadaceae bacterium]|nr:hypothetical protein [Pyrinomonadaceae bacterium]
LEQGKEIEQLALAELKDFSALIDTDVYETLTLEATLNAKSQIGGTAREAVNAALAAARQSLAGSSPGK